MSNTCACSSSTGCNPCMIFNPATYSTNPEMFTNYEQLQMYNAGNAVQTNHDPLFQGTVGFSPTNLVLSSNTPGSLVQQMAGDPRRMEMFLHAKDQMVGQLREVVERQNKVIADFQKQLKQQGETANGKLMRRLQDRERDVQHLRMRLETETAPKYEVEKLRRTLGQTEYELEKTEKLLQETLDEKKLETERISGQLSDKVKELEHAAKENLKLEEEKMALKTRIASMDEYFSDLPTSEDYKRIRKELKYWKSHCSKLQNQMVEQEEKISSGKKVLEEKAINADRFEKENTNLKRMVKNLQDMMKNDEIHAKTLELEHVKFENERLQADLTKMEKLFQENQKKAKAFYQHSQGTQKKLEERLSQEEDTVAALREELTKKEFGISECKSSMKQLSTQYQDLVEEKMDLTDKLKQLQTINSKEALETNRKVYKQIRRCVNKVKDIMHMYCQKKEGNNPDLSLLLGTGGHADTARNVTNDERSLSDDVNQLMEDIDEFRAFLADQYAEELANNIEGNCITH